MRDDRRFGPFLWFDFAALPSKAGPGPRISFIIPLFVWRSHREYYCTSTLHGLPTVIKPTPPSQRAPEPPRLGIHFQVPRQSRWIFVVLTRGRALPVVHGARAAPPAGGMRPSIQVRRATPCAYCQCMQLSTASPCVCGAGGDRGVVTPMCPRSYSPRCSLISMPTHEMSHRLAWFRAVL